METTCSREKFLALNTSTIDHEVDFVFDIKKIEKNVRTLCVDTFELSF